MLRNTPLEGGLPSPAQLLQGRSLYDGIPIQQHCLFPRAYDRLKVKQHLIQKQNNMKASHDTRAKLERSIISEGQKVRFRTIKGKWEKATVVNHHNTDRSYLIRNQETGTLLRRNRNQLRPDQTTAQFDSTIPSSSHQVSNKTTETSKANYTDLADEPVMTSPKPLNTPTTPAPTKVMQTPVSKQSPPLRTRFGRVIRKPLRYRDE